VIGAGFLILAMFLTHQQLAMVFCILFGMLVIIFAFTRHLIAFRKLSKHDLNYLNQNEIEFVFRQAEFIIQGAGTKLDERVKYGEISNAYKDKRNYYLLINEEDLQVIPYQDFAAGTYLEFESFIANKIGKPVNDMNIPFKERLRMINEKRKQAEAIHDEKIKKKRQEKER